MKKITRTVVGVVLIILGLAALLTPLSPGSWLILVGLEVLGWRIVLENKLWAWTSARPDSKMARAVRRILCLRIRDAARRRRCKRARQGEAPSSSTAGGAPARAEREPSDGDEQTHPPSSSCKERPIVPDAARHDPGAAPHSPADSRLRAD